MTKLTKKDINNLRSLLKKIDILLKKKKYKRVVERSKFDKKLIGPLGEAYAVIEIGKRYGIEQYKESDELEAVQDSGWKGGQNKGYDIETIDHKKIQVKTSYDARRFQILSIKMEKPYGELIKQTYKKTAKQVKGKTTSTARKFKLPEKVSHYFKNKFDYKYGKVNYWVLVWAKERRYFIIPNRRMREFVGKSYENYFRNRKHRESFNYGISKKTEHIQIIFGLHPKEGTKYSVSKQLLKYENKWW